MRNAVNTSHESVIFSTLDRDTWRIDRWGKLVTTMCNGEERYSEMADSVRQARRWMDAEVRQILRETA